MDEHGYPKLPARPSLTELRDAVQRCRACDLWANATQGVFGDPSSIFRAPDEESRQLEYRAFVKDLKVVARLIEEH